ncbi:MAG: hypothetical protein ACKVRO_19630 [Micropepsaceae bacterium]
MSGQSTPFPKSWGLYAMSVLAMWVIGPAMAYFGYYGVQSKETIVFILGGACLIAGPLMVFAAPFMPRPASGPCPLCGAKMYGFWQSDGAVLVCRSCAACATASNARLSLVPVTAVADTPLYPAALPWDDIVGETPKTIAFSAQDVVSDKLNELITRNDGVRLLDKWPAGCCVCGGAATRHEAAAVEVSIKGRALETKATLAARGVPYCGAHKDGIAFATFDFAGLPFQDPGFGIKFRSHAYREAFRKLNPHKFDTEPKGPVKIRTP